MKKSEKDQQFKILAEKKLNKKLIAEEAAENYNEILLHLQTVKTQPKATYAHLYQEAETNGITRLFY